MTIAATFLPQQASAQLPPIAFIGGGNMASAMVAGLLRQGLSARQVEIVEPWDEARKRLEDDFSIVAQAAPGPSLARCKVVVWAVKPQTFAQAAAESASFTQSALHLSIAAGIPSDSIARWLGSESVVRAMPNTPALVGRGMTGLYARPGVQADERTLIERVLAPTGRSLWVADEAALDAVTALSGSGPAYVFFFIEAMIEAGREMGLEEDQARQLAIGTFTGASALAADSNESPAVLRQRVTSKGGTTHAAISEMERLDLKSIFKKAIFAAQQRAGELGAEFGRG